ncbi:MAG: hypothetical protein FJ146_10000 [Deltaproteobacteria bacterium]|nr:hypothetical protein [Deltaproteobacteria bacterium]
MTPIYLLERYIPDYISLSLQLALIYVLSTISFDLVHVVLHRFAKSKHGVLRRLGMLHETHHQWFGPSLQHERSLDVLNIMHHRVPEYLNQLAVTLLFLAVCSPVAVGLIALVHTIALGVTIAQRGVDINHQPSSRLKHPRGHIFVGPSYHYLHHVYAESHMGSFVQTLDKIMGTCVHLEGQRIVMTGASGAYGSAMKALLEDSGAVVIPLKYGQDYDYNDYSRILDVLSSADILVLAHGVKSGPTMAANCNSFVQMIELFKDLTKARLIPPQVWAVGSEIELHSSFGIPELEAYAQSKRAFAAHAKNYYRDEDILYRHIVPSAFTSRMGRGLISASLAAWWTMWLIRRGCRYVPVTYTGVAYVNYLKFLSIPGIFSQNTQSGKNTAGVGIVTTHPVIGDDYQISA